MTDLTAHLLRYAELAAIRQEAISLRVPSGLPAALGVLEALAEAEQDCRDLAAALTAARAGDMAATERHYDSYAERLARWEAAA